MRTKIFNGDFWLLALLFSLVPVSLVEANEWSESYQLEAEGKYSAAAAVLDSLLAQKPISEFGLLRRGWLNYSARNYNDSISDYQHALTLNPNSLDARLGLTLPFMAQGRWREAALHAGKILDIAPWQYYAHIRLMACEEAMMQWDVLEKHAKKVAERYPSDATIQVFLARAHLNSGNRDLALAAYARVTQIVPNHMEATQFIMATKAR